ncbi:hypothetical protein G9A89_005099 [Geosiphon pyriformis]|nr:hypothetical protein G9A89_005099 [Geosiphon pyriformis]
MEPSKIQSIIKTLVFQPKQFSTDLARLAMTELLQGQATPAQASAFLMALKLQQKDSNAEIVAACATSMLELAKKIDFSLYEGLHDSLLDIVGTGGDGVNTFNVSTTSGIVAAGAGCKVAKVREKGIDVSQVFEYHHGNRAASSKSGSADILESFGCEITNVTQEQAPQILSDSNFCFLFAPTFHPLLKNLAGVRREIGVPTIFNLLGPLINPAQPKRLVVGVHSKNLGFLVAEALRLRGVIKAMVVHGAIGLDEISPEGETFVWELSNSKITEYKISPIDFGLPEYPIASVKGGSPEENSELLEKLLSNDYKGPILDFVLMNTAAGLVIAEHAKDFKEGVSLARESISSGRAKAILEEFKKATSAIMSGPGAKRKLARVSTTSSVGEGSIQKIRKSLSTIKSSSVDKNLKDGRSVCEDRQFASMDMDGGISDGKSTSDSQMNTPNAKCFNAGAAIGSSIGSINYGMNDEKEVSLPLLDPKIVKSQVEVAVKKSFALDINLSAVEGKSATAKTQVIKKLFSTINGFGGATTPSKFEGII